MLMPLEYFVDKEWILLLFFNLQYCFFVFLKFYYRESSLLIMIFYLNTSSAHGLNLLIALKCIHFHQPKFLFVCLTKAGRSLYYYDIQPHYHTKIPGNIQEA